MKGKGTVSGNVRGGQTAIEISRADRIRGCLRPSFDVFALILTFTLHLAFTSTFPFTFTLTLPFTLTFTFAFIRLYFRA